MLPRAAGFILGVLFLFCSCRHSMNREQGERSLKVMNSNLVNFFSVSAEKPETQALWFLLNSPSSPLSLKKTERLDITAESKGVFEWSAEFNLFQQKDSSSQLILIFPADGKEAETARFALSDFETRDCKNRPEFPVTIDALVSVEGTEKLKISHRATLEDELPLVVDSRILGDGYSVELKTDRTREGNSGTLNMQANVQASRVSVCSAQINATIEYSRQGYYFRYFDFVFELFEHRITGNLDYSKIDPTASDYVRLFNRYSTIEIVEKSGKKVGNIVLGKSVNEELLDYYVRFSNGQEVLLSSYIPMITKILDFKY